MSLPLIGIDYDESPGPHPNDTYRGVVLDLDGREFRCFSGNATIDLLAAMFIAYYIVPDCDVSALSSVDHFITDGGTLNDDIESWTKAEIDEATELARTILVAKGLLPPPAPAP